MEALEISAIGSLLGNMLGGRKTRAQEAGGYAFGGKTMHDAWRRYYVDLLRALAIGFKDSRHRKSNQPT
jgi:hypothetical protein